MRQCEKMREWTDWKDVGIKKNYFRKLGEAKDVKFREDRRKIWATWEERVSEDTCLERGTEARKAAGSVRRARGVTTIYTSSGTIRQ
jgi:hypothetical protein